MSASHLNLGLSGPFKFNLNKVEIKKYREFEKQHIECLKKYNGCIGGHFSFKFTCTTICNSVEVFCNICNTNQDITDWDSV